MAHPKNELIDRAKKQGLKGPEFETEKTGPEHEPRFQSLVRVDGTVIGRGEGNSKRVAEAAAAEAALTALNARAAGGKADASGTAENATPAKKPAGGKKPKKAQSSSGDEAVKAVATPARTKSGADVKPAAKPATKPSDTPASSTDKKQGDAPKSKKQRQAKQQTKSSDAQAAQRPAQPTAAPVSQGRGQHPPQRAATPTEPRAEDEPFDGPWPMFDDLLAAALQIADRRVPSELKGDAALAAVRDFSLKLYKDLLTDLGELQDVDEDD